MESVAAGLKRRRDAAWRMPPLECGCRDPDYHQCADAPLTDHQIERWRWTVEHLLHEVGCSPIIPVEVLRALWRRGGKDRVLVHRLYQRVEGIAA